jgi:hypothetical protein
MCPRFIVCSCLFLMNRIITMNRNFKFYRVLAIDRRSEFPIIYNNIAFISKEKKEKSHMAYGIWSMRYAGSNLSLSLFALRSSSHPASRNSTQHTVAVTTTTKHLFEIKNTLISCITIIDIDKVVYHTVSHPKSKCQMPTTYYTKNTKTKAKANNI